MAFGPAAGFALVDPLTCSSNNLRES